MANGMGGDATSANARTLPQLLALIIGAVYVLVGIVGFFVTGVDNFATPDATEKLLWFELNPLHNVAHLLVGVAGVVASSRLSTTRSYGWALAAVYGLLFVYGLFVKEDTSANFLDLNGADNVLHLLSALAGAAIALLPVDNNRSARSV